MMMKTVTPIFRRSAMLMLALMLFVGTAFAAGPPNHEIWNRLLKQHVNEAGDVNYKGFQKDSLMLNKYLAVLAANHPEDQWSDNEKMAYWLNAYNAFTVKLIVDNYPVKSIKELGGKIYKINTPWARSWIKLGEETYSLDNIEHGILRKDFEEPRIHFAANCASESCPRLRAEAYTADKLNAQLDDQAKYFINNVAKNEIKSSKEAELSKIFSWFKGDFTKKGSLIDFLNQYADTKLDANAKISHKDYGWKLNE